MIFKRRAQTKVHHKIFLAQQEARSVARAGHNGEQGFEFSRFEDVLAEGKRLLQKHRLVYISEVIDVELIVGKNGVIAKTTIEYEVTDLDGGGSLSIIWVGTGHDSPGDKAIYKSETGTEKYFLARLLQIPFGTDPEEATGGESATELIIPPVGQDPVEEDPDRIRAKQDAAAEASQAPPARHEKPLPNSDHPPAVWETGAERAEEPTSVC